MVYCIISVHRVELIVGSHTLIHHLSIVLLGSAMAIWALESGTVIGPTLVFGLWAMQVAGGFAWLWLYRQKSKPTMVGGTFGVRSGVGRQCLVCRGLVRCTLDSNGAWCYLSAWSKPYTSHRVKEPQSVPIVEDIDDTCGVCRVVTRDAQTLGYSGRHSSDAGFHHTRAF